MTDIRSATFASMAIASSFRTRQCEGREKGHLFTDQDSSKAAPYQLSLVLQCVSDSSQLQSILPLHHSIRLHPALSCVMPRCVALLLSQDSSVYGGKARALANAARIHQLDKPQVPHYSRFYDPPLRTLPKLPVHILTNFGRAAINPRGWPFQG